MARKIDISVSNNEVTNFSNSFTAAQIRMATTRAINYALKRTRTQMKRVVTSQYNIRSSDVNNRNIVVNMANRATLSGNIMGDSRAESIAHFPGLTEFRDVLGGKRGGGHIVTKKGARGLYSSQKKDRNTSRSGLYFQVVKGSNQHFPSAFLVFFGTQPVVMARGGYMHSGQTKDFRFAKPGEKKGINAINSKSIFWGVLNNHSVLRWQPYTEEWYLNELNRQFGLL